MSGFYVQAIKSQEVFSMVISEVDALALAFRITFKDPVVVLGVFEIGESLPVYLVKDCKAHQVTMMGRAPSKPTNTDYLGDIACTANAETESGLPASVPHSPLVNVS